MKMWKAQTRESDRISKLVLRNAEKAASRVAWSTSALREKIEKEEAAQKQSEAVHNRAVNTLRALITETEVQLAKEAQRMAVDEEAEHWITPDKLDAAIERAINNPVPLKEGMGEEMWIKVAKRRGAISSEELDEIRM